MSLNCWGLLLITIYLYNLPNRTHFSNVNVVTVLILKKTCWEVLVIIADRSDEWSGYMLKRGLDSSNEVAYVFNDFMIVEKNATAIIQLSILYNTVFEARGVWVG